MGIAPFAARHLALLAGSGVDFDRTLTLGRQSLFCRPHELTRALRACGQALTDEQVGKLHETGYAEGLFRHLGADVVESMDASDYEHPSHVHDLNEPVEASLHEQYTAVHDGGTLEHVFNFPLAIANAMNMVRVGGHFISVTVANNYGGHGFYQFSPELFYRVLSPENGFEMHSVLLYEERPRSDFDRAWLLTDPAKLGRRLLVWNARRTLMLVCARKIDSRPPFATTPQQSDYTALWRASAQTPVKPSVTSVSKGKALRARLREPLFSLADAMDAWRHARNPFWDQAGSAKRVRLDTSLLPLIKGDGANR